QSDRRFDWLSQLSVDVAGGRDDQSAWRLHGCHMLGLLRNGDSLHSSRRTGGRLERAKGEGQSQDEGMDRLGNLDVPDPRGRASVPIRARGRNLIQWREALFFV